MIKDGRVLGVTIAFKHLLEALQQKGILSFAEREAMLDDIYHELNHIPALKGEALNDATITVGALRNCCMRADKSQ